MKGVAMELGVLLKLSQLIFCPVIAVTKQLQPPHYKAKEQRLRIPEERCWLPYRVCNMKDRLFPTPQQTLLCICKKKKNVLWHHL